MPSNTPDRLYQPLPRGRWQPGRLLWILWAGGTLAMMAGAVFYLLAGNSVPSRNSYVGALRPEADPVTLSLPEGAVLNQILVERNETVTAGQTVITLDVDAMQRYVDELEEELMHDSILRDCLLSGQKPALSPPTRDTMRKEIAAALSLANRSCAADLDKTTAIEATRSDKLDVVSEEQALIERYIHILTQQANDTAPAQGKRDTVLQALSLALAQNRLNDQAIRIEAEARDALHATRQARLQKIRTLGEDIRFKKDMRRRLLDLLDTPRIQVPESGRVMRVRSLPKGAQAGEMTDILEIRPEKSLGYQASFTLEAALRDRIQVGQKVEIEMLGMAEDAPLLIGEVSQLDMQQGSLQAQVRLSMDSVAALDDPRKGIALRGRDTASVIHVRHSDMNALLAMRGHLRSGLLGARHHFPFQNTGGQPAMSAPLAPDLSADTRMDW
jgi:multidrug efflux pump subunit AcrA (membrane-fusion protein)